MLIMKTVWVLNGPNLNLLGSREPEIYGKTTLRELIIRVKKYGRKLGLRVKHFQSNHEGRLVDKLHRIARRPCLGVIFNPGALTHYSYSLRDAISATGLRVVEVHLSDIEKREPFRRVSVIKDVCISQIKGLGVSGYLKALDVLLENQDKC